MIDGGEREVDRRRPTHHRQRASCVEEVACRLPPLRGRRMPWQCMAESVSARKAAQVAPAVAEQASIQPPRIDWSPGNSVAAVFG